MKPGSTWSHGRVRVSDAVHTRLFDEELVILDLTKGEYFALDPIGARLWTGLETGKTIEQIVEEIVSEYDVGPENVMADLLSLGDEFVRQGLMVSAEELGERA